jgi:hypothetical protein
MFRSPLCRKVLDWSHWLLMYSQPVIMGASAAGIVYNSRKLVELPYQLANSFRDSELLENCLCNIDFLTAKVRAFCFLQTFTIFSWLPFPRQK